MDEKDTPPMQSPNGPDVRLGPDHPIRTLEDLRVFHLDLLEAQRKRVARALTEEAGTGGLDKTVSIEVKRSNTMVVTQIELINMPQARTAAQPRTGTGAVSQILASLAPKKHRHRKQKNAGDVSKPPIS